MAMMNDNISYMADFQPLSDEEHKAVARVTEILKNQELIPCTSCRYCTEVCPQGIAIPEMFGFINDRRRMKTRSYSRMIEKTGARPASECINCGACEASCPQHIEIRELLGYAAKTFEK
jgi:predicted aldo/keto reductase-like oxidoreductase